jgi:hypothetical protein
LSRKREICHKNEGIISKLRKKKYEWSLQRVQTSISEEQTIVVTPEKEDKQV